jgi:oligoribonuclease
MSITADTELAFIGIDLECTGFEDVPDEKGEFDDIVEFGVIGLNRWKQPLFEVETIILPTAHTFDRINGNPFVHNMFTENGLLDDLETAFRTGLAPTLSSVGEDLVTLINRHRPAPGQKVVLLGSGVATYDLRFLKAQTKTVAKQLQYWTSDVGVIRREWKLATGTDLVEVNNDKTHRGFDDILCHVEESRAFSTVFERLAAAAGGGDINSILAFLDRANS